MICRGGFFAFFGERLIVVGAVYWRDEGRKRKGVEGEMGLAKARRCAGPFGRRGIARLLV